MRNGPASAVFTTLSAMHDFAGKRVTVMGLGRFGGGIGVTRWLCEQGADVVVTDRDSATDLADSIAHIQDLIDLGQVELRLGEHNVSDFTSTDLVVANAAVPKPWENRFLRAAQAAGVDVTTEITLTIQQLRRRGVTRIIGVTGSAGKSTTSAMIEFGLRETIGTRGTTVLLGGNIGGSLLAQLKIIDAQTVIVLELSSAMLYWLEQTLEDKFAPKVAVCTNIAPNHLDWHGALDHYENSKINLIRHQTSGDVAVLGSGVWNWREQSKAQAVLVEPERFPRAIKLPGEHNRFNAAAALLACQALCPEASTDALVVAIANFGGLAHRLQLVERVALKPGSTSVLFYNDSKSTTPDATLKALDALLAIAGTDGKQIHLIAGGYDKGSDLTPIAQRAATLAGLYCIGATGPTIAQRTRQLHEHDAKASVHATLSEAFKSVASEIKPGDIVLLSPGCASWDQYVNFEARGDEFVQLVRGLATAPTAARAGM